MKHHSKPLMIETGPVGVAGIFTLEISKVVGYDNNNEPILELKERIGPFKNLITDQGLDRMGNNASPFAYCQVGSGSTAPAFSNTALVSYVAGQLGSTDGVGAVVTASPYTNSYAYKRCKYQFGVGAAAGNLSEVGTAWAASGATLFSRQLILDGSSTPITITVLSDEVLTVYYEFRVYPPVVDVTGTMLITGTVPANHNYIVRACEIDQVQSTFSPGWASDGGGAEWRSAGALSDGSAGGGAWQGVIGTILQSPTGTSSGSSPSVAVSAYSAGSLERIGSYTFGLATTNPIRSIRYRFGWTTYQLQFDPAIPKTADNTFTVQFKHSWARRTI